MPLDQNPSASHCHLLGREKEWAQLHGLLKGRLPRSLFLFGPAQSGKLALIRSVTRALGLSTSISSCHMGTIHPRLLYQDIVTQLFDIQPEVDLSYAVGKLDHLVNLVTTLKHQSQETMALGRVIVLKESQKLRDLDFNLLPGFLKLQEWTGMNICVVFVSRVSWNKFLLPSGLETPRPMVIHQYTKEQLTRIIASTLQNENSADKPNLSSAFYENYVFYLIGVFYLSNNTLPFLLWIARHHFPAYYSPISAQSVDPDNTRALIRNIEKTLRSSKTEMHIRETGEIDPSLHCSSIANKRIHVELPFHSKFLLIASYLASYNPVNSDKRFFMKHHGSVKKRAPTIRRKEKMSSQLTGPKAFTLDRMMAIFYSIVDDDVRPSANISSQISTLVSLQFLSQVGGDDMLDCPKYKCIIGLDFVAQLAKQVQFEIHRYLVDFT